MKNKIICITIIVIIGILFCVISKVKRDGSDENKSLPIDYTIQTQEISQEEQEKINEIATEQGYETKENIYEVAYEYDGREVITIKPSIRFKVALSGIIKNNKPEFSEIDELLEQAPNHTGIWISPNSRDAFLELIKNITNSNYEFAENGFLLQKEDVIMNKYDKKISEMILGEKLYVFDINSTCYIVDEVTGEIQEYPFEEMDPYTEYEYFETQNMLMFIISKNNYGKINQKETLKDILDNIQED